MEMRVRIFGLLARAFRKEMSDKALKSLQKMRFPTSTGNATADEGYRLLYEYLMHAWSDSVTELAIDFVRTFVGHGVNGYSAAYPFESVYTSERRLLMQEARAEVLQTMRENNLRRGIWTEGEDHIALELEFMQRMSRRTAAALRDDDEDAAIGYLLTQRRFLREHLLNWVPMLVADMRRFSRTQFYQGLGLLLQGYLEEDDTVLTELLGD
jgi:TorA-specific chaperone